MGKYFRKIKYVAAVCVLLFAGSQKAARAQWAVFDPAQTLQSMMDAFQQLMSTLDQLDVLDESLFDFKGMKEWFDKSFGEGSSYQQIRAFAQDLQMLQQMANSLNMQMKACEQYISLFQQWGSYGYNPNMITQMIYQVNSTLQTVQRMIDMGDKILRDTGLTRAEKKQEVDKLVLQIDREAYVKRVLLEYEMKSLEEARAALQFDNFLMGRNPDEGLNVIGSAAGTGEAAVVTDNLTQRDEGSVTVAEAVGDAADNNNLRNAWKNGFSVVSILMAFLAIFSVVVAFVRYSRGDHGSERMFVRIAVACVAVVIVLSVLTRFVGFGF